MRLLILGGTQFLGRHIARQTLDEAKRIFPALRALGESDIKSAWSGRVFYTALGHRQEVWQDPRFQQHLLGALRWALGV